MALRIIDKSKLGGTRPVRRKEKPQDNVPLFIPPRVPPKWIKKLYTFIFEGKKEQAGFILFEEFDKLFRSGEFEKSDHMLFLIDIQKFDTFLLVALLASTLPAKEHLKNRPKLIEKVESRLRELAPDRVEALINGLR